MSDLGAHAHLLANAGALDPLMLRIGAASVVMLGAADHGTHDFQHWRVEITRRLVAEHGFSFVAVEGDWSDCARVDRAVRSTGADPPAPVAALRAVERWPTWTWANEEVLAFCDWLRQWNAGHDRRVGFHGLDVYGLRESTRAIVDYLRGHDPAAIPAAVRAYRALEPPDRGAAVRFVRAGLEPGVLGLLTYLRRHAVEQVGEEFAGWQSRDVVPGAEGYYRSMVAGDADARNLRATHLADTLDRLLEHYGRGARAVVWAHNAHVGDARATAGPVGVGQLARQRHGSDAVVLVGFGGYQGTVVAATAWGEPPRTMAVPPARDGSVEALLRGSGHERALFVFPRVDQPRWLTEPVDHRAMGVLHEPHAYEPVVLGARYDAFCWFHHTTALHPLHALSPEREPSAA
ncbi:erythromycin esterase family protein [Longispora urticae]